MIANGSLRRALVLLALLAGGACAPLPAQPPAAPAVQDAALAARQVLVMLHMPPPHFHAGADYAGGYGTGGGDGERAARRRLAQALAREHGLRVVDDWPMPAIGVDCYVMQAPAAPGPGQAALLSALARDPRVAWAEPVRLYHGMAQAAPAAGAPADPLYPLQPDGTLWHAAELHRASTGRGVRVAVVDSGIDGRHPDLAQQIALNENFVDAPGRSAGTPPEAHGTAVAGIIAARAGNGLGIAGLAPEARLLALRACWQTHAPGAAPDTLCSSFTLAKALHFALLHDARIINLSLGGPPDRLLRTLVESAIARGIAVVGAVDPADPDSFPAAVPGVLAVAAGGPGAATPTRASAPALRAPGVDVPTCLPGARWGFVSGSSYAAAHVSGLLALLAQLRPRADGAELRSYIVATTSSSMLQLTANRSADAGSGVTIDACASIARAAGTCVCSCHAIGTPKASSSP